MNLLRVSDMFDGCSKAQDDARCTAVAGKLALLFGWRQTYNVAKLQRSLTLHPAKSYVKHSVQKTYSLDPRTADSWVAVQSLQTSDGGILDPDDRLHDVVDDREQIVATYSDGDGPHHGGGDGASGSSVGTSSPDIFQGDKFSPPVEIEVTSDAVGANSLQVRRGSEPALNQIDGENGNGGTGPPSTTNSANKRWSAAPIIHDLGNSPGRTLNGHHDPDWQLREEEEGKLSLPNGKFQRDGSNRLSMQFLMDGPGLKWMDAVERMAPGSPPPSVPRDRRREPLGQANAAEYGSLPRSQNMQRDVDIENMRTELIILGKEGGPLGIHVVPDYDSRGRDRGLLVQGIEPNGRVARDGRLAVFDRIVEINGANLLNKPFHRVQEIFKNSLSCGELRLRVVKHIPPAFRNGVGPKPPMPVYPNGNVSETEPAEKSGKVATISPSKKPPATAKSLLTANTRRIGRRIELDLVKGPAGLGFSITTRDNPAGGNSPIYIKNILSKGAAVDDGRLCPGDRLLYVNGIAMTGKSQPDAVAILRQVPAGATVRIVVSRQEEVPHSEVSTPEKPPRTVRQERCIDNNNASVNGSLDSSFTGNGNHDEHMNGLVISPNKLELKHQRSLDESQIYPWKHREVLTLDIPVHDTEKAGLGVSVKGKTSATHGNPNNSNQSLSVDLGIFVKSVINGGAASRDGRLRTNDQLLSVNGKSLLNQSNANAMETLRKAMLYVDGPRPGVISLTIARRVSLNNSSLDSSRGNSSDLTPENSVGSETSDSTVIFLPHRDVASDSSMLNESGQELRHPVIDRITGQHAGAAGLRNESYYRATHDYTWNTSNLVSSAKPHGRLQSPTVNPVLAEPVLIEEDYPTGSNYPRPGVPVIQNLQTQRADGSVSGSGSISTHGDVTYASQQSLEEPAGFARDAVGRQSMSEKRHATLDAKNTDTYRRQKKMREERHDGDSGRHQDVSGRIAEIRQELLQRPSGARMGSAESLVAAVYDDGGELRGRTDIGPSLGMRKSSSLESLQTMVQEIQMAEDGDAAYSYRTPQGVRVVRGRGCNDSFRAAVDRSYEAPLGSHQAMETLSEEEAAGNCGEEPIGLLGRGTPRQSSMNAVHNQKLKKKPGLLKGIGSMFRFGKHRKPVESSLEEDMQDAERERNEARLAAQMEHQKIQEQYRRLQQQQQMQNMDCSPAEAQTARKLSTEDGNESSGSRTQRIHQLRQQHQRRHVERQGQYPLEEQQEHYEHLIRQRLDQPPNAVYGESGRRHQHHEPTSHHGNKISVNQNKQHDHQQKIYDSQRGPSKGYEPPGPVGFGEDGRPGSRSGITDPARFSHYVNYEEIQQHLNRRKQHYHSQRRDPRETAQQRPVSNFYEYETVQSVMMDSRAHDSLPRRHKVHQVEQIQRAAKDSLARRLEEESHQRKMSQEMHGQRIDEDSKNNNPPSRYQKDALPQRLEEEFQRQARAGWNQDTARPTSVRNTVNYLNQLSRGDPGNVRAKGPFISQITIRENPDES